MSEAEMPEQLDLMTDSYLAVLVDQSSHETVIMADREQFNLLEEIAHRWNAHGELVAAFRRLRSVIQRTPTGMLSIISGRPEEAVVAAADAALAKATGKPAIAPEPPNAMALNPNTEPDADYDGMG